MPSNAVSVFFVVNFVEVGVIGLFVEISLNGVDLFVGFGVSRLFDSFLGLLKDFEWVEKSNILEVSKFEQSAVSR